MSYINQFYTKISNRLQKYPLTFLMMDFVGTIIDAQLKSAV